MRIPKRVCLVDVLAYQLVGPLHQDGPTVRRFEMEQVIRNFLHPMEGVVLGVRHLDGGLEAAVRQQKHDVESGQKQRIVEQEIRMVEDENRHSDRAADDHVDEVDQEHESARCMNTVSMK